MAEPSTIARPYAAALFQASDAAEAVQLVDQLDTLARVSDDSGLRQFAANPKVSQEQVLGIVSGVAGGQLSPKLRNFLVAVIENGRLSVLPEIASQFRTLVNDRGGVADAQIVSAFPLDAAQQESAKARDALRDQVAALAVKGAEQILRREVNASVHADLLGRLQTEL